MTQHSPLKVLVDGAVFSEPGSPHVAMWKDVLSELAGRHSLVVLDRGNTPILGGAMRIPFPAYYGKDTAADSALIQELCALYGAEVFLSTGYTSPLSTPSLLFVGDTLEGVTQVDDDRRTMEKELAIHFARSLVCASDRVRDDLVARYPRLQHSEIGVIEAGRENERSTLAAEIERRLLAMRDAHQRGVYDAFLARWSELRTIQAAVDF